MADRKFTGTIGRTLQETRFSYEVTERLPKDAPNVVYILMDDMGFAHLGCYGSNIHTPNIDSLANQGLRYNNFHTTAVCSATRTSLLTGANHHAAGCASLIEYQTGLSNGTGHLNPEYATVAEILHEYGYATFCSGKWHLASEKTQAGPYDSWPLQKGFDRYYGFLHGENDQYHPHLVRDNSLLTPEEEALKTDQKDYHFSKDIVDNAIENIFTEKNAFPEKPFFLYLAFGAMHAPHHAPKEYIDRYKGAFDDGWDEKRKQWFKKQKEIGIIPQNAELTDRNEYVDRWESLSAEEKRLYARYMEAFAGMLEYTDEQIGRLLDYLKEIDEYENTIFVFLSDNGASAEGGKNGRLNCFQGMDIFERENEVERSLKHYDEIGTEDALNHYPTGWANAGNTPFQWYKIWAHEGGIKDPLIVSYPKKIKDYGGIRGQYHHVSDITPTILEMIGITKPQSTKGVAQKDFTGISFAYTFADQDAESRKHVQYYEVLGNRGIYKDGWKAVVNHVFSGSYAEDQWELYHVEEDYSEKYNVAEQYPEKLRELQDEFLIEAARNNVFPMLKKAFHTSKDSASEPVYGKIPSREVRLEFKGIIKPYDIAESNRIDLDTTSYHFYAKITRESEKEEGVIFSAGDKFSGFTLYIKDNRLKYVYNYAKERYDTLETEEISTGTLEISYDFIFKEDRSAQVKLYVNDVEAGSVFIPKTYYMKGFSSTIKADKYTPVSPEYEVPFEFTGKIHKVVLQQIPGKTDETKVLEKQLHAE